MFHALAYPKVRGLVDESVHRELWFEDIVLLADMMTGSHKLSGVCTDADHDKYLAAALEGRAAFVVTDDTDFLAVKEYEDVRIVMPRGFLDLLEA